MVKKYGLTLLTTADEGLEAYISKVMAQVQCKCALRTPLRLTGPAWLLAGNISRLVMAIISKESRETLERWQFDIKVEDPPSGEVGKENSTWVVARPSSVLTRLVQYRGGRAEGGQGGEDAGADSEGHPRYHPPDHVLRDVPPLDGGKV